MAQLKSVKPALVRDRLRKARRLAGLSATEAWKKMGYQSAAQLSKMESETSTSPLNYNFIIRAAICYGVSTDYLFGLSHYDEPDPQFIEQKAILTSMESMANDFLESMADLVLKSGQEVALRSQLENLTLKR